MANATHDGSGSQNFSGFNNTCGIYNTYYANSGYKRVRLIKINNNGNKSTHVYIRMALYIF